MSDAGRRMKKGAMWLCSLLAMLVIVGSMSLKVSAATYSNVASDDGKWKIWINTDTKRCSIKPAKAGVSGVSSGAVVIPAAVKYKGTSYKVTGIASSGFAGNTKITSVSFEKAVNFIVIGNDAFKNCTALASVYRLENTVMTTIGDRAFYGDKKLVGNTQSRVVMPKTLKKIGASAFEGCSKVNTIDARTSSGLNSIGAGAFKGIAATHTTYTYNATTYNLFKNTYKIGGTVIACNYDVTYNNNTSPAAKSTQTLKYGSENSKFLANTTFKRTGYTLDSWNTKADGKGTKYTCGAAISKITDTGAINLYAIWKPITYKIRFNANSGSGSIEDQAMTYDVQRNLSANKFIRNGYLFDGWATSSSGAKTYSDGAAVKNLSLTAGATVDLYAKWKPIQYRINFSATNCWTNKNTGEKATVSYDKTYIEAKYGETVNLPQDIVHCKGYKFNGWLYKGKTVTTLANVVSVNNGSVTVIANMDPISYHVVLHANGGNLTTTADESHTSPQIEYKTAKYAEPFKIEGVTCERKGYTFAGWGTLPEAEVKYRSTDELLNLAEADNAYVVLYAIWQPISYTVEFEANAPEGVTAEGKQSNLKCTYDQPKKLRLCGYTCPGYKFTGWNTAADGSGQQFAEDANVQNLMDEPGTYKLYAQWTPVKYKINFAVGVNGGGTAPESIECEYGKPFTIPEYDSSTMFRDGYHFVKWCTDENELDTSKTFEAGKTYDTQLATEDGQEITLYGIWVCGKYKIRFVTGTDSVMADKTLTYSDSDRVSVSIPEPAARAGYEFSSWNTAADGSGIFVGDKIRPNADYRVLATGTPSEEDPYVTVVTLYARWSPLEYKVMLDIVTNEGVATLPRNTSQEIKVVYGTEYYTKLPTPTLRGYDFEGWKTEDGRMITSTTKFTSTEDITVYPKWQIKKYNVTFKCNGGTLDRKSEVVKTYNWNTELGTKTVRLSDSQKRNNKLFLGWYYKERNNKIYVNSTTRITKNLTLYADIRRPNYNVKFDLGYRGRNGKNVTKTVSYKYNSTLNSESRISGYEKRSGYLFDGWYYKKNNKEYKASGRDKIKGSLTLTAHWKKLTVVKNGSKLNKSKRRIEVTWKADTKFIEYQYRYAKKERALGSAHRYTVKKKNNKPLSNGLNVPYSLGHVYVQVRAKYKDSKGNVTYTSWVTFRDVSNKRDTVTFDPKGGLINGHTTVRKVTYVKGLSLKSSSTFPNGKMYTPKKNGYTFKGWYYRSGRTEKKVTISTRLSAGTRVYAKWKRK